MGRHRLRLPFAVVATVVAVAVATFALRPRTGLVEPATVDSTAYFSPAELDRASDFRGPQRALGLAGLGVSGLVLAGLAIRPPRAVRRALERAGRRPLAGGAAAGAALSLALVAVTLPFDAAAHVRAVEFGLSTQSWPAWAGDTAKAAAIGAVFSAGGAAALLVLLRRAPRRPWLAGSVLAVTLSGVFVFLSPLVLEPLFNRFEPLPRGELRADVLDLADRAGVEVGEVYRVDASRRTTGANAYVGGLGATKRVVLYDTLLERFPPDQVRSVVAHELGHVEGRDLWRGLAWLAIVAPAALFLTFVLTQRLSSRDEARPDAPLPATPAVLPAVALSLALVSFAVGAVSNFLSRQVEARADGFALRLTDDPEAFVELERGLALSNLSEPDPPALFHALLGTHPTTVERIGFGRAFERERGATPPPASP